MPTAIEQSGKRGRKIAMNSAADLGQARISRGKAWEEAWPYVLGIVVTCLYTAVGFRIPKSPNLKDVFIAVISVSGIAAAFFLTSASILVSLRDSWFKQRVRESGTYVALIGYMLTAMGWSLATAVVTTIALSFDAKWELWWYRYALTGWVFLIATTLGVSVRVLRIFSILMKYIAAE